LNNWSGSSTDETMLKTDKLSQQVYEFLELPDLEAFFVQSDKFFYG